MLDQIELARLIAHVAHGATGQTRADGVTPYITHPEAVAHIVSVEWAKYHFFSDPLDRERLTAAALLHDVVEDTSITGPGLVTLGVDAVTVDMVLRLSKRPKMTDGEMALYFKGIAEELPLRVIKLADRKHNLKGALSEVRAGRKVQRWTRYALDTRLRILPLAELTPPLMDEILPEVVALEAALRGLHL